MPWITSQLLMDALEPLQTPTPLPPLPFHPSIHPGTPLHSLTPSISLPPSIHFSPFLHPFHSLQPVYSLYYRFTHYTSQCISRPRPLSAVERERESELSEFIGQTIVMCSIKKMMQLFSYSYVYIILVVQIEGLLFAPKTTRVTNETDHPTRIY